MEKKKWFYLALFCLAGDPQQLESGFALRL